MSGCQAFTSCPFLKVNRMSSNPMIGSLIYVRVSGFYFLPVFEGKPDVVLGIDRDVVHQPVPSFQREFRHQGRGCINEY